MKKGFLFFICLFFILSVSAQRTYDTTTTNIMSEIAMIQASLKTNSHLGFDAVYYFEDLDSVAVYDTMQASYQMDADNFHIVMDSIESFQNSRYNVTVYPKDSLLVVQDPIITSSQIMQLDVMDSTFQQLAMFGMTATDSGSYRKIILQFDADAIYTSYQMVYNVTTYQPLYVKFSLRKNLDPQSLSRINMFIKFSHYTNDTFTDAAFATDDIIIATKEAGLKSKGSKANYEVVDLIKGNE